MASKFFDIMVLIMKCRSYSVCQYMSVHQWSAVRVQNISTKSDNEYLYRATRHCNMVGENLNSIGYGPFDF